MLTLEDVYELRRRFKKPVARTVTHNSLQASYTLTDIRNHADRTAVELPVRYARLLALILPICLKYKRHNMSVCVCVCVCVSTVTIFAIHAQS